MASDVAIGDDFMSGIHFEIENNGNVAELRDRNSTNKTWVNHTKQVKCPISPGDVIRAGKTLFSIRWEALPSPIDFSELPKAGEVSLLPKSNEDKFASDNENSSVSRSPIGSSFVVFPKDKAKQLSELKLREAEEVTNSIARSRNSSPFESLSASYLSEVNNHFEEPNFVPPTQEVSPGEFHSPIDESSISYSPGPPPASKRPIPIRLSQSTSAATGFDIWAIIEVLSNHCDLRVVSHYRKIGQLTPSNLVLLSVFPFLADSRDHLPVIVKANEWLRQEDRQLTNRLVQADGLVLVLTKGTLETDSELQKLCNFNVSGFPESNGFLGWCWPSQLQAILNNLSDPALTQFFGDTIQGFLFPSASNWIAYANPEMMPILADHGFV